MARVRTEEKRDEIVRIAAELFEKHGYDRCSMAALSERLGGSKATLYGYFPSKEDLLRAVIQCEVASEFDRVLHRTLETETAKLNPAQVSDGAPSSIADYQLP